MNCLRRFPKGVLYIGKPSFPPDGGKLGFFVSKPYERAQRLINKKARALRAGLSDVARRGIEPRTS